MSDDFERGKRLGPHELLLLIGRGGMATVWVARRRAEEEEERIVAVKAILADLAEEEEFVNMFLDEGQLIQRIRHPNVVDLYEVGQDTGVMYMSMEWIEGDSLHTLIAEAGRRRPIPPEMAVRIVADAAAGLHAAHELKNERGESLGVVHRDVSPHNILIGTNGSVKLVDFGVAKALERLAEATVAGQVKGKFGYMSPEQAVARSVDRRSDVFALGIVLFEVTTGRRLFRGNNDAETLHLVVEGDIPRPSSIDPRYPPVLEQIVLKALSRSRRERFQTAEDLQKALEGFLKQERTVVPRVGIASLLKKVLGSRIEMRRKAVRAAIKEIDGAASSSQVQLVPSGSAFTPTAGEHVSASGTSGVSGPASGSGVSSAPGVPHDAGQLTGSFVGVGLQSTSQPTLASAAVGQAPASKAAMLGYVVGILGLVVAAGAILLHFVGSRGTVISVTAVPTPSAAPTFSGSSAPSAAPAPSGASAPTAAPTPVEQLAPAPRPRPLVRRASPAKPKPVRTAPTRASSGKAAGPKSPAEDKPAPKEPKPAPAMPRGAADPGF